MKLSFGVLKALFRLQPMPHRGYEHVLAKIRPSFRVKSRSKYEPHQGAREMARRVRQMNKGGDAS